MNQMKTIISIQGRKSMKIRNGETFLGPPVMRTFFSSSLSMRVESG